LKPCFAGKPEPKLERVLKFSDPQFTKQVTETLSDFFVSRRTFDGILFSVETVFSPPQMTQISIQLQNDSSTKKEHREEHAALTSAKNETERKQIESLILEHRKRSGEIILLVDPVFDELGKATYFAVEMALAELPPSQRGRGIMKRFLKDLILALRTLSTHPACRIELYAQTTEGEHSIAYLKKIGGYVWPNFGFDMSDRDPETQMSPTFEQIREQFIHFLHESYTDETNPASTPEKLSLEEFLYLSALARSFKYPWEIGLINTQKELGRSIGKENGRIGKEFLISLTHQGSDLSLYFNQLSSPGMIQFQAHTSETTLPGPGFKAKPPESEF
jgi:hypothetical protein